jgi:hypothetical protein|tara:strand:- start:108 stop:302 length:195 start_codon:yes stop_codon:yes gene_type:complete
MSKKHTKEQLELCKLAETVGIKNLKLALLDYMAMKHLVAISFANIDRITEQVLEEVETKPTIKE